MDTFEFLMKVGPQIVVMIGTVIYLRTRPKVRDFYRKTVIDRRLGTLGLQHFNTTTKNCYDYGCTDDCPVARSR